jgi:hypothetical protein
MNFTMISTDMIIVGITIAVSLAAIVFSFGVVWRTEKELDISYKFFLGAIIMFTVSEFLSVFYFEGKVFVSFLILSARLLFAILFLAGMAAARDMLRRMDGEKGPVDEDVK